MTDYSSHNDEGVIRPSSYEGNQIKVPDLVDQMKSEQTFTDYTTPGQRGQRFTGKPPSKDPWANY